MANSDTAIEWTDKTWNPAAGCTKISRGCDNCYAATFAERWRGVPGHAYEHGFDLRLWPHRLSQPGKWRKPCKVFVNSMSDLFHKGIPDTYRDQVFDVMEEVHRHTYQVLTKRSSLLRRYAQKRYETKVPPPHIWLGVSVEDRAAAGRIKQLQQTPAGKRFLSVEPLIGSLGDIDLSGIDWVIVGGESGPGFRDCRRSWIREVRDQCIDQGVAFFFKQWGGHRPKSGGRSLDGRVWSEYPI